MREILFKAKRIDNGEWVEGCLLYDIDPCKVEDTVRHAHIREIIGNLSSSYQVDPATVCQYIGLKDKSGEKLREGDKSIDSHGRILQIVHHCCRTMFKDIGENSWWRYADLFDWVDTIDGELTDTMKVTRIGNIHD